MTPAILLVDDEAPFLESVQRMLRMEGYEDVTATTEPLSALKLIEERSFDIAMLDITMPEMSGLDLLRRIKERNPETECLMVTASEGVQTIVKAVRRGAYDYLVKPVTPDQLACALDRALEHRRLLMSIRLRSRAAPLPALKNSAAFEAITTSSHAMMRVLHEAELHAASDIPILVTGETGSGKELLARAIHLASRRSRGPFVAVNMLALSTTLFESEFFGHLRGSFTGADRDKAGYMAKAGGGTLFLDEIGDLALDVQGKLLRILQEGEYAPVGATRAERADVRFVAATNQDLETLVEQKRFRKDLFYRLQFAHLHVPALRDRPEDIPVLARKFAAEREVSLSREAEEALSCHAWPGNVRELKGACEAAANLAEAGTIEPGHLRLPAEARPGAVAARKAADLPIEPLCDVERRHILLAYEQTGRNKNRTARALGIGLQTLHRRLKAYGVK